MSITATQAHQHLQAWLKASDALAEGKSYTLGTRRLTLADGKEIQDMIKFWSVMLDEAADHPPRSLYSKVQFKHRDDW